jgi:hypothetical protein
MRSITYAPTPHVTKLLSREVFPFVAIAAWRHKSGFDPLYRMDSRDTLSYRVASPVERKFDKDVCRNGRFQ